MKSISSLRALLIFLLLPVFPQVFAAEVDGGVHLGYRTDQNQWTISGGEGGPNIISDLEWSDLQILELEFNGEITYTRWALRSSLAFGMMTDGANRDSDYVYDNREGEFSRSTADTEGSTLDFTLEAAYRFQISESGAELLPLIGFQYAAQYHEDTNGVQEIDRPDLEAILDGEANGLGPDDGFLGPFDGLDSTYDATWYGPYIGLEGRFPLGEKSELRAVGRLHIFAYEADLYWNLRDLDFENEASGIGWSLQLHYLYRFSESWRFSVALEQTTFESDEGTQTDPEEDIDLNEATWESFSLQAGFLYSF